MRSVAGPPARPTRATDRPDFNDTDARFVEQSLATLRTAAGLGTIAAVFGSDAGVRSLGRRTTATQSRLIAQVTACLRPWPPLGTQVPATRILSAEAEHLLALDGDRLDEGFLAYMSVHSHTLVTCARTEVRQGLNPGLQELAAAMGNQQPQLDDLTRLGRRASS